MKAIINGKLILPHQVLEKHLVVYSDKIIDILPQAALSPEWEIYDAKGSYVAPGFLNLHIHGCAGCDTMDGTPEALLAMAKALPQTGVTGFLPTTMTQSLPAITKALKNIRAYQNNYDSAQILGAHLEGPFLSKEYKGAQPEAYLCPPDFTLIEPYIDIIKIITLAPELKCALDFIKNCAKKGIVVSLGHSKATYEEALAAFSSGADHVTHLFNAMAPLHHRHPGLLGAALDNDSTVEIICDNLHLAPAIQRLVYKGKEPQKIILITDSLRASLLGDGPSELGGQPVFVKNGRATLGDGTLAGSILAMNQAVKNFYHNTKAPLPEVIAMASLNPARRLGLENILGSLEKGKLANMTLLTQDFEVVQTFLQGKPLLAPKI